MMAERTLDAIAFMDLCAALGYPEPDVVRIMVESYGYDRETALLAVEDTYYRRAQIDAEDAATPSVEDLIAAARSLGRGDALVIHEAEAAIEADELVPNDIVHRLRELVAP